MVPPGHTPIIATCIYAYKCAGFWIRQNSFKEQPTLKFKYQYLIILESELLNSHFSIICTTYEQIDPSRTLSDNCSLLKVGTHVRDMDSHESLLPSYFALLQISETDDNNDGKNDRMKMVVHVTNVSMYDITSVHLFLIFDYKIYVSEWGQGGRGFRGSFQNNW